MTDAELIAVLLARLGGHVLLGRKEIEAAKEHGWRITLSMNPMTGDAVVELRE